MKPRVQTPRRIKLPPLLEIDEDGVPVAEMSIHEGRRWSADRDESGMELDVSLSEWPAEFDD